MRDDDFITAIYHLALGRAPDGPGLHHWSRVLTTTGDPTRVLSGIMSSAEATQHHESATPAHPTARLAEEALAQLERPLRIVDIGAQSLGEGSHPYSPLDGLVPLDIIGFDPLAQRLDERQRVETVNGSLTLLPYAIADEGEHVLYINNDDSTSSLFPLNIEQNALFNHISTLKTVRTETLTTRSLDDVVAPGPIDFLKIDVQGGALLVLKGASARLATTAVVHCETEFSPIYVGQALYSDIHTELASAGFYLVDLMIPGRYHYLTASGTVAPDRLLWADAVFFRETDDVEVLVVQAVMAAVVYGKPTLAEHLLSRAGIEAR